MRRCWGSGASLHIANLSGANLSGADLRAAILRKANPSGAALADARELNEACGNMFTQLPEGFSVQLCSE